jgi:hypothetical protein
MEKSLKIPKGQSETYIEEEQTTQWAKEKGQTTIDKTYI